MHVKPTTRFFANLQRFYPDLYTKCKIYSYGTDLRGVLLKVNAGERLYFCIYCRGANEIELQVRSPETAWTATEFTELVTYPRGSVDHREPYDKIKELYESLGSYKLTQDLGCLL